MPRGRPPHKPTDRNRGIIQGLAMVGVPDEEIARQIGIDPKTLRKHYRDDLDLSMNRANLKVANALYKTACDTSAGVKHVTAAMFWLECKAGWRRRDQHGAATGDTVGDAASSQTVRIEFVGPDGGDELGSGPLQPGDDVIAEPDDDTP